MVLFSYVNNLHIKRGHSHEDLPRTSLARIMRDAWNLARHGSQKFGGNVTLYFALALHLVWQDAKQRPVSVWHSGLGNQFLIPGLPLPLLTNGKGQLLLPGMGR